MNFEFYGDLTMAPILPQQNDDSSLVPPALTLLSPILSLEAATGGLATSLGTVGKFLTKTLFKTAEYQVLLTDEAVPVAFIPIPVAFAWQVSMP
jgi:hypothetical protein